jgi:hypothetical protein
MPSKAPIFEKHFWTILRQIDSLEQDISFEKFFEGLDVNPQEALLCEVIQFMMKFDYPVKVRRSEGVAWIHFTGPKENILLDFSFSEWISLQAHFPLLQEGEGTEIFDSLSHKLEDIERVQSRWDLFRVLQEREDGNLSVKEILPDKESIINAIDKAMAQALPLHISAQNKKNEIWPHKVVFIDGKLTLIAEDIMDRCLVSFNIVELDSCLLLEKKNYHPNFALSETDDFVSAIRAVSGNEMRLILKVNSPEKVNLTPPYHFLANPYVTVNSEGEFIWAASVEVSDELYLWLTEMKDQIEILDPPEIRQKFQEFVHQLEKSNEWPLKKAS